MRGTGGDIHKYEEKRMRRSFLETLNEYCSRDYYPWHMPGHKRMENLVSHRFCVEQDVTELPGLDNLHVPEGAIAESMAQLPDIYGSWKSYYLVNGSTCGILTAISAVCNRGDTIIMGRHCHKSVYHAVALLELKPIYLYPNIIQPYEICGSISPEQVEKALKENPEAKAVIFPSPTYEGVLSDVKKISDIIHKSGIKLIVDEAHGAHLEFGTDCPQTAIRCGADLVIESLHKTLPCYTQCAILHVGDGSLTEQVERYLSIYQTSSPSYLLVANMEDCIATMEAWRDNRMREYYHCLRYYREKWSKLTSVHLLIPLEVEQAGGFAYDESKLVFGLLKSQIDGAEFLEQMESEFGMVLEMASVHYVLAMTSVADSEEAFLRLDKALKEMDERISAKAEQNSSMQKRISFPIRNGCEVEICREMELIPGMAWKRETESILLSKAAGRIAGDFVTVYPPGIPILVPGERIQEHQIAYIRKCLDTGLNVHGIRMKYDLKAGGECITVLSEEKNGGS